VKAVELAPLLKRLLKIVIEIQIASPRSALQKELQVGNTKPVAGVFFFSAINRDVRRCPGVRDKGAVEAAVFRPQIGYYKSIEEEAAALMGSPGNNHGFLDGNKRIAFTATDVFLRRNGFYIEVEGLDGYAFIYGSMDRHEFRFAQILDWIRQHIKPLV
jgi:death-on-curing protein